jgi:hypothetical protein
MVLQATASVPEAAATPSAVEKLRLLHILQHVRWQAGTLFFLPTAEETVYLPDDEWMPGLPAQLCGAFIYLRIAGDVALLAPLLLPRTPAEAEARLHGFYGALRTALELDARGVIKHDARSRTATAWWQGGGAAPSPKTTFCLTYIIGKLLTNVLSDSVGLLSWLRATCGLTPAEETALHQLAARVKAEHERIVPALQALKEEMTADGHQTAAADAARHGLRRCALPACDAQEPHPKLFKLCGRCRGAAYCCAAHSAEDWKRHKREDGCKAAAQSQA